MSKKLYINCVELQRDIRTNLIEQYKGKSLGETMFALEKKVKKAASKPTATPKTTTPPPASSDQHIPREDIQLRAYFISERRQTMGWPGNSSTDWIEAESQLVAEAKRRLKKIL